MAFERIYLHLLILSAILVVYGMKTFSFKNGVPTCDNFIINVYLYLALSIIVVGLSCYFYNYISNKPDERNKYTPHVEIYRKMWPQILFSYLISFGIIIYIAFSEPFKNKNYKSIHLAWLLFLVLISTGVYPYFKSEETKDIVENALLITGSIFVIMSSIAYAIPKFFENSYNFMSTTLLVGLLVIIIVELFNLLFNRDPNSLLKTFRFTSYIVIFLFTLFVSYDTHRMVMLKKMCTSLPNYPKFSLDFFLDILNLFKRIVFLRSTD